MNILPAHKGVRAAAAALSLIFCASATYELPHQGFVNHRFATCMAERIGGEVRLGTITDHWGKTVAVDPLLKTYGMEMLGRRAGVTIPPQNGKDILAYLLHKTEDGTYKGSWDFTRIAGKPLPTGTWGRSDIVPSVEQQHVANIADYCANNTWVNSTAGRGFWSIFSP